MSDAEHTVRFILDGKVITARDVAPTTTLLQYLRDNLGRTGTKEGCAEGDCGACTVVVGELDGERTDYRAINSCIRFLPTVDGKEVVTAESLKAANGTLHPVQQAMVDCHASQCGFCTPGFVMSLFGLYLNNTEVQRQDVVDVLSGNLCRCTGYRPIIDAGCRMNDYPQPDVWNRFEAQSGERRARLRSIGRTASAHIAASPGYHAPLHLDELARLYEAQPHSLLLAGGTDIGLWVTKHLRELPPLIYLGEVAELKHIREVDGALEIGAAVALTDAYAAIVSRYPMLDELFERFGSVPVRNSATLCGNIANGSPIGDSMPILLVLGATVQLRRGDSARSLPLEEFYLGYQKKALAPGELVSSVRVPLPRAGCLVASHKVSKRFDQDISALCGAYAVDVQAGKVSAARIAFGGMAAIPQRARRTEAALVDRPWTSASIDAALPALAEDYQPISDMRASSAYRLRVAGNLLKRFYLESSASGIPTRVTQMAAS